MHKRMLPFAIVVAVFLGAFGLLTRNATAVPTPTPTPTPTSFVFNEPFTSTTYIDTGVTDAVVDTGLGRVTIPLAATPQWTQVDGSTPGADNVSNNVGPSFLQTTTDQYEEPVFDSSNRPILWWYDETSGTTKILVSRWNGSTWTGMDGTTPGADTLCASGGFCASMGLVMTAGDHPVVVWYDYHAAGVPHVYLARWNGGAWAHMDGVTPGVEDMTPSLDGAFSPKVRLDQSGLPVVMWLYTGASPAAVHVTRWNGSNWTKMDGTTAGYDVFAQPLAYPTELLIGADDMPIVAWRNSSTLSLNVTHWNGSVWTGMDGVTPGSDQLSSAFATFATFERVIPDPSGNPMVLYDQQFGSPTKFSNFTRWNGSAWTHMDGVTIGSDNMGTVVNSDYVNMGVGPSGFPTIVQIAAGSGNVLRFSRWDGSVWVTTTRSPFFTAFSRVLIDNNGLPVVLWAEFSGSNPDIKLTRWNGHSWVGADGVTAGVSAVSSTGAANGPVAAMNDDGDMFVAWYNNTPNSEMMISRFQPPVFEPDAVVQSSTINDATPYTIDRAHLTVTQLQPDSSTIDYEVTNNGGTDWLPISPESTVSFVTVGSDLRWRGTLQSGSTPILSGVNLAYTIFIPTPAPSSGGGSSGSFLSPEQLANLFGSPTPSVTPTPSASVAPSVSAAPQVTPTPTASIRPSPTVSVSAEPTASETPLPVVSREPLITPPSETGIGQDRGVSDVVRGMGSAIPSVATVATVLTSLFIGSAVASISGSLLSFFSSTTAAALSAVGLKRRRRVWGIVYDARTKAPIPYAKVELKDASNRVLETRYANHAGQYGFLTSPTSLQQQSLQCSLAPSAKGYTFPSTIVTSDPDFIVYDHVYHGGLITISSEALTNNNIPMDPVSASSSRYSQPLLSGLSVTVLDIAFWIGLIATPINAYLHPSGLSVGILVVFLGVNAVRSLSDLYRPFGAVTDSSTNAPLSYALVTLSDSSGKRISYAVSDVRGRYILSAPSGSYTLTAYTPAQTQPQRTRSMSLTTKKGWVRTSFRL